MVRVVTKYGKQCLFQVVTKLPLAGQEANVLQARSGTPVMFIRIDRNTAGHKGCRRTGNGEGGSLRLPFDYDVGDSSNGDAH